MLKKDIYKIVLFLLILFSVLSGIVAFVSYARYSEIINGDGRLEIAKWNVTINEEQINENLNLNLFETATNANIKNGLQAIVPGTTGQIDLNIKNESDVVAEYTINIEETKNLNDIPILYSLEKDGEYKELSELSFADNKEIGMDDDTQIVSLYWKWDYYKNEEQNLKDNELGQLYNDVLQLTINVRAVQKVS